MKDDEQPNLDNSVLGRLMRRYETVLFSVVYDSEESTLKTYIVSAITAEGIINRGSGRTIDDAAWAILGLATGRPLRQCSTCRKRKPYTCFGRDSSRQDGTARRCLTCERIRAAVRRDEVAFGPSEEFAGARTDEDGNKNPGHILCLGPCHRLLPPTDYSRDSSRPSGLSVRCRKCDSEKAALFKRQRKTIKS